VPAGSSQPLVPSDGERGLASYDAADLTELAVPAWDGFIALAEQADLGAPSRLEHWSAHDVCVHLGSWPDRRPLERMAEEARRGDADSAFDQDGHNDALVEAHRDAPREEVLDRLREARDETAAFLGSDTADELGTRPVRSVLGPLPLLTVVVAGSYELAVHALDLAPAGAPVPPDRLLGAGLAALTDVTGALAARCDLDVTAAGITPEGSWAFGSRGEDWTTMNLPTVPTTWPAVEAPAAVLLDVSAGRRHVPALLARRELRLHHAAGLLALAPIVEQVPGLPGGAALGGAVRHLLGVGRLVRRLPGVSR
jgi:uncharacterized protein (TIGR03083 family)